MGHHFYRDVSLSLSRYFHVLYGRTLAFFGLISRRRSDDEQRDRATGAVSFLLLHRSDREASWDYDGGGHFGYFYTLDLSDALHRTTYRRGPTSGDRPRMQA